MYQSYLALGYVSLWAGFVAYIVHFNLAERIRKKLKGYHLIVFTVLVWVVFSGIAYAVNQIFHVHIEIT